MEMGVGEEGTQWCKRQTTLHYERNGNFLCFFGQTIKNRFEFVFEFEFKVWRAKTEGRKRQR